MIHLEMAFFKVSRRFQHLLYIFAFATFYSDKCRYGSFFMLHLEHLVDLFNLNTKKVAYYFLDNFPPPLLFFSLFSFLVRCWMTWIGFHLILTTTLCCFPFQEISLLHFQFFIFPVFHFSNHIYFISKNPFLFSNFSFHMVFYSYFM